MRLALSRAHAHATARGHEAAGGALLAAIALHEQLHQPLRRELTIATAVLLRSYVAVLAIAAEAGAAAGVAIGVCGGMCGGTSAERRLKVPRLFIAARTTAEQR